MPTILGGTVIEAAEMRVGKKKTRKENKNNECVVQKTCSLWFLTLGRGSGKGGLGGQCFQGSRFFSFFLQPTKGCGSSCLGREDWVSDLRRRVCTPFPPGTRWCWIYGYNSWWKSDHWMANDTKYLQKQREWRAPGLSLGSACFLVHVFIHLIIFTHSCIFQYLH